MIQGGSFGVRLPVEIHGAAPAAVFLHALLGFDGDDGRPGNGGLLSVVLVVNAVAVKAQGWCGAAIVAQPEVIQTEHDAAEAKQGNGGGNQHAAGDARPLQGGVEEHSEPGADRQQRKSEDDDDVADVVAVAVVTRELPLVVERLRGAGGSRKRRQLLTEAGDEQRHRCLPASRFTANIAVAGAMQAQDGMAGCFVIAPIKGEGRAVVFELQNIRRTQMQGAPGNGVVADVQAVAVKMQAFRTQHVTRLPQRPPQGDKC